MNRYPLTWPDGWTRTHPNDRMKAPYKVSTRPARILSTSFAC